jgi:hypothetical protein
MHFVTPNTKDLQGYSTWYISSSVLHVMAAYLIRSENFDQSTHTACHFLTKVI